MVNSTWDKDHEVSPGGVEDFGGLERSLSWIMAYLLWFKRAQGTFKLFIIKILEIPRVESLTRCFLAKLQTTILSKPENYTDGAEVNTEIRNEPCGYYGKCISSCRYEKRAPEMSCIMAAAVSQEVPFLVRPGAENYAQCYLPWVLNEANKI